MSLFSVTNRRAFIIHPNKVNIEGDVVGSYLSGRVEMFFKNETPKLEKYHVLIGQSSSSNICLHDFKVMLDSNPLSIKIMEKDEAKRIFIKSEEENKNVVFGIGNDSYAYLEISNSNCII